MRLRLAICMLFGSLFFLNPRVYSTAPARALVAALKMPASPADVAERVDPREASRCESFAAIFKWTSSCPLTALAHPLLPDAALLPARWVHSGAALLSVTDPEALMAAIDQAKAALEARLDAVPGDKTPAAGPLLETVDFGDLRPHEPIDDSSETDTLKLTAADAESDAGENLLEAEGLQEKVRRTLKQYRSWQLNTLSHSPWAVMHAIIAHGVDTQVLQGGPGGDPITAVGWLCYNRPCAGQRLFGLQGKGLTVMKGPGLQGHYGQFLAVLAQSRIKTTYPLKIQGRDFTVADLVRHEQDTCRSGSELTFKLIGLSHYLPSDAEWENDRGQKWTISKLLREEIEAPVRGAACGGTHRLFSMAYAVNRRAKQGEPIDGEFARAQKYLQDFHAYTFSLQNEDGSFSTEWFRGRGDRSDLNRRLQTTGHILEWLAFSLPEEELSDPRMVRAVDYLAGIMLENTHRRWENGPLGHAIDGLRIYHQRAFEQDVAAQTKAEATTARLDDDQLSLVPFCTDGSGTATTRDSSDAN